MNHNEIYYATWSHPQEPYNPHWRQTAVENRSSVYAYHSKPPQHTWISFSWGSLMGSYSTTRQNLTPYQFSANCLKSIFTGWCGPFDWALSTIHCTMVVSKGQINCVGTPLYNWQQVKTLRNRLWCWSCIFFFDFIKSIWWGSTSTACVKTSAIEPGS